MHLFNFFIIKKVMMINEIMRKRIGVLVVCSLIFIFILQYFFQPTTVEKVNNNKSCLSRYESGRYRKESLHKPSSYLISRLREYEALHTRCGPYTEAYKQKIRELKSGHLNNNHDDDGSSDCKYLVRIPADGLGNRMLSLASAFLYALLTNRVLLVYDNKIDMSDLFCEPFPESTWLLPQEFPLWKRLDTLNQKSPESYGNILNLSESYSSLSFLYLHISGGYNDNDKRFYCDQDHRYLGNISWLIMKSNFYFIPSLFLIPSFEQELAKLFPVKDTVFHVLGRYLFLPSNPVWNHITRYYQAYLAKADEIIGIQIRVFDRQWVKMMFNSRWEFQTIPETVLSCSFENNLLPEINTNKSLIIPRGNHKSIAVLVTSLTSDFFEKIEEPYLKHSTVDGTVIKIFHPSSEGKQETEKKWHNMKAWSEMYLLSLSDKLITSPGSTFGYVAQGLGGLTPWMLHMPDNGTVKNPPCSRAMSMEPCFHVPPSYNNCEKRPRIDPDSVVSPVRRCEDITFGVKLVDPNHI